MVASPQQNYITPEEYLQFELQADVKHEYIDGYAYAMAVKRDSYLTICYIIFNKNVLTVCKLLSTYRIMLLLN